MTNPIFLNAIVLDADNNDLRITEGANTAVTSIPAGTYFLRGDGAADDILLALKTAMETNSAPRASLNTYTPAIAWSADPAAASASVTIPRTTGGDDFAVLWADPLTTFDQALLGFVASDTVDATTKASTLSPSAAWVCDAPVREFEPIDRPRGYAKRARSGKVRRGKTGTTHKDRRFGVATVAAVRTHEMHIPADPDRAFNRFLDRWIEGTAAELHLTEVSAGFVLGALSSLTEQGSGWHVGGEGNDEFAPPRLNPATGLYSWDLELWPEVA